MNRIVLTIELTMEGKKYILIENYNCNKNKSLPWSLCCSRVQRPEQEFVTKTKKIRQCLFMLKTSPEVLHVTKGKQNYHRILDDI